MWGAWWVWDARLTSVLVLFFLYLGHVALVRAFDDPERGARSGAILALIGAVNLPIIKFSVDWWNTLHQPASVTRLNAPALHVGHAVAAAGLRAGLHPGLRRAGAGADAGGGDGAADPRAADGRGAAGGDRLV